MQPGAVQEGLSVRTDLRPGDLGAVVRMHGLVYAREHGFDPTFEAYVAGPLAEFILSRSVRGRLWLAERLDRLVGCVAIVPASPTVAQLRWFLVEASERGAGLGRRLLADAVAFAETSKYRSVILWTEQRLTAAARLYGSLGFRKVLEKPGRMWGRDVVEELYERALG
jgi:GNAT superfamily N-acetyltransferase